MEPALNNFLTYEKVQQTIDNFYSDISNLREEYAEGFVCSREVLETMNRIVYKYIDDMISKSGLRFHFSESSWNGFLKDYENWESLATFSENELDSWLLNYDHLSASAFDRQQVIRLIREIHILPSCFRPLPSCIIYPRLQSARTWATCPLGLIDFCYENVDKDGFFTCSDPFDKIFTFQDELGLRAKIKVKESFSQPIQVVDIPVILRGVGYIEGYTEISTSREHSDIYIVKGSNKKKLVLLTHLSKEDFRAHRNFPLWNDYFQWCDNKDVEWNKILYNIFRKVFPDS